MSGPLLRFLFRRHVWTLALCGLVPIGIGTIVGIVYPTFEAERATLGPVVRMVRTFIRTDLELVDVFSPPGAFNFPYQHPLTFLAYAVVAAIPTLALPAGARGQKTLDLLLATPLTRQQLVVTVAAFIVPGGLLVAAAPLLGAVAGASISGVLDAIPIGIYALTSVNGFAIVLFLGGFGLLLSVVAPDRGRATTHYASSLAFFFLADFGARFWKGGSFLGALTPLGFYNPTRILTGSSHLVADVGILLAIGCTAAALALFLEKRRREV